MKSFLFTVATLASMTTAHASDKVAIPDEPAEHPNWAEVRTQFETKLRGKLYDPQSAQFTWVKGFQWGYVKDWKRRYGWVACAKMNAKNRLGGYVGAAKYYVLYTPNKELLWDLKHTVSSQCDSKEPVALQPELMDASPASSSMSLADELTKLASLLEKGLITREEFDAQKAKLITAD